MTVFFCEDRVRSIWQRSYLTSSPCDMESALAQAAIHSGERCPAATRSGVEPASEQHSLGGRFDTEARRTGGGRPPAHAPMRPGHVIAIGQPLLPVAPLKR